MVLCKINHPTLIAPGCTFIRDRKIFLCWFWCYNDIMKALRKIIATSRVFMQKLL